MTMRVVSGALAWVLVVHAAGAAAQAPPVSSGRVLDLSALQEAAIEADPRFAQVRLLSTQSDLRLRNISVARLPSISVDGQAQYQSDVPSPPVRVAGNPLFSSPKATYDSSVRVEQRLFDATIAAEGRLERAVLAEQQARVRAMLFGVRQQVNEAFFSAAGLEARRNAAAAAVSDLSVRLEETNARVREGAALSSDAASIEATLLQLRQDEEELRVARRVALARLSILTGQTIGDSDTLTIPDLSTAIARARQSTPEGLRARPEYDLFSRTEDRLATQQEAATAQERPRVSTFARVGYGRPGLNFVRDEFDTYGLGGVRVQWNTWTWGRGDRERAALAIQRQIVAADQAAFTKGLGEATGADTAAIDRLRAALEIDDRIIALREQVERTAQARFNEGVLTASDLLARSTELLQARYARAAHEVDLAQAGARLLTTLGLEVR